MKPYPSHKITDLPAFIKRVKAAKKGWAKRGKKYRDQSVPLYLGGGRRRGPNSLAS